MKAKFDVLALGELLMDMTNNGCSSTGNTLFEANPGGAPCNVLSMLRKLGHPVSFMGKVGDDLFGHKLAQVLRELDIDTQNLVIDSGARTTLAFVQTFPDGDRDFSFYRNPGADMLLTREEVDVSLLRSARIFHFGTLSMTHEGVREATLFAAGEAKKAGALISFDPNLRPPLWEDLEDAREQFGRGMELCDILKISDNEIQWFTGEQDYTAGVQYIRERYEIPFITVSMGKEGSRVYYKTPDTPAEGLMVEAAPFLQAATRETTGAGDTFGGCILHGILEKGLYGLKEADLREMLTFANAAASIVTTRKGALRVMPSLAEIQELLASRK